MSELTSDSIIERLRANAEWAQAAALGDPHCGHIHEAEAIEWTAAADRIEQLEADRATLAEIVRLLDVSVEPCPGGGTVWRLITDDWFDYALTPERAERFQQVLDRIEGGETDG